MATWQYSRRVPLRWNALLPAARARFAGSLAGAWAVTAISPDFLRRLLPLVLVGVLAYTLARKDMGRHHRPRFTGRAEVVAASLIDLCIGCLIGTHMALKHGTGFVRGIFIVVVGTLILKTGYDAFLR